MVNGMFELLDQYERMSIALKLARGRTTKATKGDKPAGVEKDILQTIEIIVEEVTTDLVCEITGGTTIILGFSRTYTATFYDSNGDVDTTMSRMELITS